MLFVSLGVASIAIALVSRAVCVAHRYRIPTL
jgi:hypothetical protein